MEFLRVLCLVQQWHNPFIGFVAQTLAMWKKYCLTIMKSSIIR